MYIDEALGEIQKNLPGYEVEYQKIKKNNSVMKDGFIVRSKDSSISPVFYLSEDEQERMTPKEFADEVAKRFFKEMETGIDFNISDFSDLNWVRNRIMFDIVNRERNKELNFANIPITNDVMIAFKVSVMPHAHIRVKQEHLDMWGITAEELFEDAKRNCMIMDKAIFKSLQDVIFDMIIEEKKELYPDNIVPPSVAEQIKEQVQRNMDNAVYVLTTQQQSSAALMYPDLLKDIMDSFGEPVVILPSSIHELLCMRLSSALEMGIENVRQMVAEVNRDVVLQDNAADYLSDEILLYDGELKQIEDHNQVLE